MVKGKGNRGRGEEETTTCHFEEAEAVPERPGFTARWRIVGLKRSGLGR
jgi:hypothetical protein